MKKLLSIVLLALLTFSIYATSPAPPVAQCQADELTRCEAIRSGCRDYADEVWAGCRVKGGAWLTCYFDYDAAYTSCVMWSNCPLAGN